MIGGSVQQYGEELVGECNNPNLPPVVALRPNRRHRLAAVRQKTYAAKVNTVISSWVDVEADVNAVNHGAARREGDRYIINGRRYGMEPGGRLFPIDGSGFTQLTRPQFRALGVYNEFGLTPRAEMYLDRRQTSTADREVASQLWRLEHQEHR